MKIKVFKICLSAGVLTAISLPSVAAQFSGLSPEVESIISLLQGILGPVFVVFLVISFVLAALEMKLLRRISWKSALFSVFLFCLNVLSGSIFGWSNVLQYTAVFSAAQSCVLCSFATASEISS